MKNRVRLTESDLTRLVRRVIKEAADEASFVNKGSGPNTNFWNSYAQRMSKFFQGKSFDLVAYPNREDTGNSSLPLVKFIGYGDRDHTEESTPLNQVTDWGMMFKIKIIKSNGLPKTKDGQTGFISLDFNYRNGQMISVKDASLWSDNVDMIANLKGWRVDDDLGGAQQWRLVK